MSFSIPHKKMEKVRKVGFIASCECGHVHRFKSNEINLSKSNDHAIEFNSIYKCPKCGQTYDGYVSNITNNDEKYNKFGTLIFSILILCLLGGGVYIFNNFFSPSQPTDIEHATNRQLNDFFNWDHKQQQQKHDNAPVFNNK
jgi:hypothetical protein